MIETYPAKAVEIYKEYLHEIVGIKFTFREVDVIACILHNRGEKKIGSLLAISYRTVGTHIRHIMGKISGNSRDDLIDFIEKSGKLRYIHEYYYHLTIESLFNAELRKIGALVNHSEAYCSLSISNITDKERVLLESIIESLKLARIYLIQENVISKKIQCNIYTFSETFRVEKDKTNISESIVIVLDQKSDISLFKDLGYINFRDYTKYYSTILELIESILKGAEVIKIIEEFNTEFKALKYSLKNDTIVTKEFVQRNSLRVRYSILSLILLVIVSTSVIYIYYLHYNNSTIHKKEASIVKLETFNIPHYLEYYIDRKELTKTIWDRFDGRGTERRTSVLVGLHGLGGIGKSTLAKNAIHNPQQQYTFKGWFNAETKDLLEHDYFQLGEKYHLFSKNMAEHQKITRVIDWIEQHGKTLLVYDNVPDLEMLEKYLPNKGHIIITSRNYKIPGAIEVDVMTEQESIQLVENLLLDTVKKSENYKFEIDQLVKELGYLPLALSHAGAYIAENALTIGGYLSLYSTEKDKLLSNNIAPAMDKHGSIYVTWDISLEKIR